MDMLKLIMLNISFCLAQATGEWPEELEWPEVLDEMDKWCLLYPPPNPTGYLESQDHIVSFPGENKLPLDNFQPALPLDPSFPSLQKVPAGHPSSSSQAWLQLHWGFSPTET